MLCQETTLAAAARLVGETRHRVAAICERYVELALVQTYLSAVRELAIDETSRARGHEYIPLAADATERRVLSGVDGRSAESIAEVTAELEGSGCAPEQIESVSTEMSPAFIKGCAMSLPMARVTFNELHVMRHANAAVDRTRRIGQRTDRSLKGWRLSLLKDRSRLDVQGAAARDSRAQADHRRAHNASVLVPLRDALQGHDDEGGRGDDSQVP
jgi:transposase